MTGTICCVATCKSNSIKSKESGENLKFFRFPKDIKIQKEWVRRCARKYKWSPLNKRICSKHFKPDDYEDELRSRLLNLQPNKLKLYAIPSLLLPSSIEKPVSERSQRMLKNERKEKVEELLQQSMKFSPPVVNIIESQSETLNILDQPSTSAKDDSHIWKRKWEEAEHENVALKKQIENFDKENSKLIAENLKLIQEMKLYESEFEEKVKVAFKDLLTPNQVEIVLKKKSKARWTLEELSRSFNLRYFSEQAYIYMRETLNYPLPGVSTLQRWASNLRNGIQEDIEES